MTAAHIPGNFSWTDTRRDLVKRLLADGRSASEIARELGGGVSRNAVIGIIHRAGLSGSERAHATAPRNMAAAPVLKLKASAVSPAFKAPAVRPTAGNAGAAASKAATAARKQIGIAGNGMTYEAAPAVTLPKLRVIDATGEPARIIDPAYRGCKWPIDDPGAGRMDETRFCCGPREVNKPYCAQHLALAWNGLPKPSRAVKQPSVGPARGPGGHRYAFGGGVQ